MIGSSSSLQTYEFRNGSGPAGYQALSVDWSAGIVRGWDEGFWSLDMTVRHFQCWAECVRGIHRSGLRVRILADVRRMQPQSREVADFLSQALDGFYEPEDRIAIVVAHPIVKMQVRRVIASGVETYVLSPEAGEQWLASFATAPTGAVAG